MAKTFPVNVSGISPTTTEIKLDEFFSFCGNIKSIDFHGDHATINFEKASAAHTALMLNGGALDGAHLRVSSDVEHHDEEHQHAKEGRPIEQSDKPRAGIAAEYLAKGYILSDGILQRAIQIDQQKGISKNFINYLSSLDSHIGSRTLGPDKTVSGKVQETVAAATQQAKAVDEQKGISKLAGDYYSKALSSPFGQKIFDFYTTTSKQVFDIHEEARRIHAEHKAANAPSPEATA
ncbi:hypothetical protein BDN72DRAFT_839068 [Pluteus cervinus]|uniref:Uncharacterized protein n=1 Tax=Pluteus cervinus TaxID=181527 RepID=A0ACD3AYB7_9AGAR|nr:hypothetical protein BDN72DRAFT_839068 [Pluteus cervinus]